MSIAALLHVVGAVMAMLASLVAAYRAGDRAGRWASAGAGLAAVFALAGALARLRAFERGHRAAVYLQSRSAGAWLDRKQAWGLAALCFALALGAYALVPDEEREPVVVRAFAALSVGFALAALAQLAFVVARTPPAVLS